MALIYCPECNSKVSDQAPHCPHCGLQIAQKHDKSNSSINITLPDIPTIQMPFEVFKNKTLIITAAILATCFIFVSACAISYAYSKRGRDMRNAIQANQTNEQPKTSQPQRPQTQPRTTAYYDLGKYSNSSSKQSINAGTIQSTQPKTIEPVKSKKKLDTSPVLPYNQRVHNHIYNNWNPPKELNNLHVIISLDVDKYGTFSNLKITQSSGTPSFDETVKDAVQATNRVMYPPEYKSTTLKIKFPDI